MKTKNKNALIILLTIIFLITAFSASIKIIPTVKAKAYIANKYNISIFQIKTKSVTPSKLYLDDSWLFPSPDIDEPIWEFSYKGKDFCVSKTVLLGLGVNDYYDDYQLEEINSLATEYLKKNVYEGICGISVFSNDVKYFLNSPKEKITEANLKSYLSRSSGIPKRVYIRVNNPHEENPFPNAEEIYNKLYTVFNSDSVHLLVYLIDDTVKLETHCRISSGTKDKLDSYYGVDLAYAQSNDVKERKNRHIERMLVENNKEKEKEKEKEEKETHKNINSRTV